MFFRRKPRVLQASPEWMIVGLGNPGPEHRGTRHNVGFQVIELLASRHRAKLDRASHRAQLGLAQVGGKAALLVKPLTYMNLSGTAVAPLARQYGVPVGRVLVVADDLDLPLGRVRIRARGSSGGHNGHKSLIAALKSQEYPRVKIGIGAAGGDAIGHVLGGFSQDERSVAEEAVEKAAHACEMVLADGLERAMAEINST